MTEVPRAYRGASTACLTPQSMWIEDVEAWLSSGWDHFDPIHAHRMFWPDRSYQNGMRILVAGCGAAQAAVIAYNNPRATVVGIDIDQPALNHEIFLRHKHKLFNLNVRPLPIEQAADLNMQFDLVIVSGVLQHLTAPAIGLKSVGDVLRPDGVVAVMLPSQHPSDRFSDQNAGPGYRVRDCLEVVERAGLRFQDWFVKAPYYPPPFAKADEDTLVALQALTERQMWSTMEPLRNQSGRHLFTACRPERPTQHYRIDFSSPDVDDYVPAWRVHAGVKDHYAYSFDGAVPLDGSNLELARWIDGNRSIGEIAQQMDAAPSAAVQLVEQLWRMDLVAIGISELH